MPAAARQTARKVHEEESLLQGKVLRAQNSFFYVDTQQGLVEAKLRGRLKKERIAVVPGDEVELELLEGGTGIIERRSERRSLLRRPMVANVDQVVLVFAAREPDINPVLIDRFLVLAEWSKIERIILCINKMDLLGENAAEIPALAALYRSIGYPVCLLSTVTGEGMAELQTFVEGRTSVFAGSSGVGKSSLLNCLSPGISLSTGAVSEKIKRGKHTTRTAQLLPFAGGFLVDTPGFSATELAEIEPCALAELFPEFQLFFGKCRFQPCTHSHEPNCAVKEAAQAGRIEKSRYASYLEMLQQSVQRKKVYR